MERYVQLANNEVQCVIESDTDPDGINGEWILCPLEVGPGWTHDGTNFTSPALPPAPPRIITHLQYMNRFTPAELRGIYTAAKTIVDVEIWLDKFKMANDINLDDPAHVEGLHAMETAQLLAIGRAAEILS